MGQEESKVKAWVGCRGAGGGDWLSILDSNPGTTKTRKVMVVGREEKEGEERLSYMAETLFLLTTSIPFKERDRLFHTTLTEKAGGYFSLWVLFCIMFQLTS